MNLDSCTPGQRRIISTLHAPLMVSAGAGSGKTFTLTQRIAYALEDDGSGAFANSIDEVLAITFTKKAAAELKSRIKAKLMEMGQSAEALKVDDAWISTIHGMCSRILREHAFELGIDPAFAVASEVEVSALRSRAYDAVMERLEQGEDADLAALVSYLGVGEEGQGAAGVEQWVDALTARALALPAGFDAIDLPEADADPSALLRRLVERAEDVVACIESLPKQGKTDVKVLAAMGEALAQAHDYLLSGTCGTSFYDKGFDAERYVGVYFAFPRTAKNFHAKESDPSLFADYRQSYAEEGAVVEAALASRDLRSLLALARAVDAEYQRIKGPSLLDNVDLLRLAYAALVENPAIAEAYRSRFKMIMVDEFQDTDELQVALIGALAEDGYANVCTVGDAQQSIYRFRGADVNVFFGFHSMLEEQCPDLQFVSLPDNFRSHADVLSLVDCIFSQDQVFGEYFLSLSPKGKVNDEPDPVFSSRPRISMALYECMTGGPGVGAGRQSCAERIAQHFSELRQAGEEPGSMVVLLGAMSNVDVYAEALRDAGFECLVAGGSTFAGAYEVQLVSSMLAFFADQLDNEALYALLSSPLFALGDDALLHLATGHDRQGRSHRRDLSTGFALWEKERGLSGLSPEQEDQLDFAQLCLQEALRVSRSAGSAAAVRQLLRASGWLIRLEGSGAQGQAIVGNLSKALRLIEDIEQEGFGPVRAASRFAANLQAMKLSPGSISAGSSDFVRIMTVHASKGLEFPHVALGDLRMTGRSDSILAENIAGRTYACIKPPVLGSVRKTVDSLHDLLEYPEPTQQGIEQASTYAERCALLERYVGEQELAESRRLLYVALTRASKSLFIGVVRRGNKDFSYAGRGVLEDLHYALGWQASASAPVQMLDYGGSAPMRFEFNVLDTPLEAEPAPSYEDASFTIPSQPPQKPPYSLPLAAARSDVFSYSSVSTSVAPAGEAAEPGMFDGLQPQDEEATALGTAFHRLAQRAILEAGGGQLACPDASAIEAQVRTQQLSADQSLRLQAALERWFGSELCCQLTQVGAPLAEVPFMVSLDGPEGPVYLEGEIDAVSFADDGSAFLVDYKTGGSAAESEEHLQQKHLLQAQCYALALIDRGCPAVKACFVRVEQENPLCMGQPQAVTYCFTSEQLASLRQTVLQAYARAS